MEIWKDIPKFEGLYQVSNFGRVKSFITHRNGWPARKSNKILKPNSDRYGYQRVILIGKDGNRHQWLIHRLVMLAFVGWEDNMQVNHINGVKNDNRLENLEWVTQSENMKHAYKTGLEKPCDNGMKKRIALIKNGIIVDEFISIREMCRVLNIERRSVGRTIKSGRPDKYGNNYKLL